MTLRSFLDCAYSLLVAEYQRLGMNLMEAVEETVSWSAGGKVEKTEGVAAAPGSERAIARQNELSLQQLQELMGGIS